MMPSRFILGAAASYGLVIGVTTGLHEIVELSARSAYAGALVVALVFNFWVNRRLVFRSTAARARDQALRFGTASCGFRLMEWLAFGLLHAITSTPYLLIATLVQIVSLTLKYVIFRRFVFR